MNPFSAAVRMMFSKMLKGKLPVNQKTILSPSGHSDKELVLMQEGKSLTPLLIPSLHPTLTPSKRKVSELSVVTMTGKAPMETTAKNPMVPTGEALEEDIGEEVVEAAIGEEEEEVATGAELIEITTMTETLTTNLPTATATEAAMTTTNSNRSLPRINPHTSNPPLLSQ